MMGDTGTQRGGSWRRGQSTLEHILVLAAILVACIVAANLAIRPGVKKNLEDSQGVMEGASTKMRGGIGLP